jgi:hypothetical protein
MIPSCYSVFWLRARRGNCTIDTEAEAMRINLSFAFFTVAAGGVVEWAGCGGDGGAGADLTAQSDGGPASSGSTSADGSSGSSGFDGGDAGASSSGALGGDGGVDSPEAGPGGNATTIACGATSCALASDACCVSQLASGANTGYGCVATTDAGCPVPAGGGDVASLNCSAQANCPSNTICCVRQTNNGAASECKATCGSNEAQLCDVNAPDGGGCAASAPCSNNNIGDWAKLPNSYATCGGKGN